MWTFVNTGRILCEASVVDFVRAMATRTSWSAIADVINELKNTAWVRNVTLRFLRLCGYLHVLPGDTPRALPDGHHVSSDWIRNLYMADAAKRQGEVARELMAERGDDVMIIDWTHDAAARCHGNYMCNVMDGQRMVLMSTLTKTCAPAEMRPHLAGLAHRGVRPRVVYVDSECCGAWPSLLRDLWPGVHVRLDGMHAIRRLTRAVSCTQHPWHPRFCAALSEAIYTDDTEAVERLGAARRRAGMSASMSSREKKKYVHRAIINSFRIVESVEAVLRRFAGEHARAGPLVTVDTHGAWAALKVHTTTGCLCDPPSVDLKVHKEIVKIGGADFSTVGTRRGASALEGFHTHQKQWFGQFARHAEDAGAALLADGTVRWNRKRRRAASSQNAVPPVFAGQFLHDADQQHRTMTGRRLYRDSV
jgi:hypothetical protein